MDNPLKLLRHLTTEQTRALFANSKELHLIKNVNNIIEIMHHFEPELYALFFRHDKQGFNHAIWAASSFTASELPRHWEADIYQMVDEHSSTLRQLAFHIGRYWTDFVTAKSLNHKPLYLINNPRFFTPYQNVGDAGNKLIKPAAMVLMHCFSCVAQLTSLAILLAATAVSLRLLPITLWRGQSYSSTTGYPGATVPLMFRTVMHLASINAQLLVMLPLAIASVFTRSATTVFSVFSNCWRSSDSLALGSDTPDVDEAPGLTAT